MTGSTFARSIIMKRRRDLPWKSCWRKRKSSKRESNASNCCPERFWQIVQTGQLYVECWRPRNQIKSFFKTFSGNATGIQMDGRTSRAAVTQTNRQTEIKTLTPYPCPFMKRLVRRGTENLIDRSRAIADGNSSCFRSTKFSALFSSWWLILDRHQIHAL